MSTWMFTLTAEEPGFMDPNLGNGHECHPFLLIHNPKAGLHPSVSHMGFCSSTYPLSWGLGFVRQFGSSILNGTVTNGGMVF